MSKESHKNEQKEKFADVKDKNKVKQEEPKTKKTKTIDPNTSESGSFEYKISFQQYRIQHGLVCCH